MIRLPPCLDELAVFFAGADCCGAGVGAAGFGAGAVGAGAAPPPTEYPSSALSSSSSSRRIAIGALTLTPSVPAATRIFAILPSSTASTSIVALSVSISAIISPEATMSPSATNHFDNVPSSIVGDKAGIRISIGIT